MKKEIKLLLKELDLSEKEIIIYLHLVGNNKLTAYQIAKEVHLHRSNCYNILDKLVNKGFLKEINLNKKKFYATKDLSNVLGKIKNTESIILKIKSEIEQIPKKEETFVEHTSLKGAFSQFNTKLYELAKKGEMNYIYVIGDSPELTTKSSKIFIEKLLKEAKKKIKVQNIDSRIIWDEKLRTDSFVKQFKGLGKNKFLPNLKNKSTTFLYEKKVSFVFLEEGKEQVIEINNKKVCEEMKVYFKYLWKQAK